MRYPNPEVFERVSLPQIAREIDRTPKQTLKLLAKTGYIGMHPRIGQVRTYDATCLNVLKALLTIPTRAIPSPEADWLTQWLDKGDQDV